MLCFELNDDKKVNSNQIVLKKRFYADLDSIPEVYNYFTKPISDLVGVGKVKKYYVVVDEIFSNIVNHGFDNSNENYITIEMIVDVDNRNIKATFIDNGIPFNPLEKEDPNTSLSAEERKEGGLGIYIVKKMMDNVSYEYKNNMNYLTVEKKY
jgi:anti-sigma regulatory factor (Ser/Thr protein kinase)